MRSFLFLTLLWALQAPAQAIAPPIPSPHDQPPPSTLRSILLEQLHSVHDRQEWFVPLNNAVAGLTAEQARWTPGPGAHSVGMLVNHLVLWNSQDLARFRGQKPTEITNNDETFNSFDATTWPATVAKLNAVLADWEREVAAADDAKLDKWASTISHIAGHDAYHVGQILYVRKLQGTWDAGKGVKI